MDVPGDIDLVHVIVRNTRVAETLEACAARGVKVAIVNSSGFREIGGQGVEAEDQLVAIARRTGLRILGPNCQGVMNSDPEVSLYSNFTFATMRPGHVSLVCQGGGVAEIINNHFGMQGIGQRMYASNGNACDISIPEIIEYYGEDPETHVIVLHVESFADPQEFLARVSPVAARKPVLALKSGTTVEGARAVSSHTGGLMARDTTSDVVFDRCGVLRFHRLSELCYAAQAFAMQPVAAGPRLGIVTNAGSPAIIVTDTAVGAGLRVPELGAATRERLAAELQEIATVANPIDMMATASGAEFSTALGALLDDPGIDAAVVCFMTPFFVETLGIASAIEEHASRTDKTLIAVAMTNPDESQEWRETVDRVRAAGVPVYYFPEMAARVLHHMDRFRIMRDRPTRVLPDLLVQRDAAALVIEQAELGPDGFLDHQAVGALLECYGVRRVPERVCCTWEELRAAGAELGYPLVLKALGRELVHKTEAGAVRLGISDEAELEMAFDELARRLAAESGAPLSFLLQPHLVGGLELIVGGVREPDVGATVMFGMGGIHVEVLRDVVFKLAPLTAFEAGQMLDSIGGAPLLDGFRGRPGVDRGALVDILLRISRMLDDHPAILELDINPLLAFAGAGETCVVDARVKVG